MKPICKIIFFTSLWMILCCAFAHAQAIRREGETFDSANTEKALRTMDSKASGGAYLDILYRTDTETESSNVTYLISADEAGFYNLWIESTGLDNQWHSNYRVTVNGEQTIDVRKTAVYSTPDYSMPYAKKIEAGSVYLTQGTNEITFIVDKWRSADHYYCLYLDYFELKPAEVFLRSIVGKSPNNIFEKKTGAVFEADTNAEITANKTVSYHVYNTSDQTVKAGVWMLEKGKKLHQLAINDLNFGWYRIVFTDGSEEWEQTFSIVHNREERTLSDSPFGLDFAGQWHIPDRDDKEDYMRAAKLLGITWLRERISWGGIEQQNGVYSYTDHDTSVNMPSENGIRLLEVFHDKPGWYQGNLLDAYDYARTLGEHYAGKIDALEIMNEMDIGFGDEPADRYSAFFKAMAIGAADSGSGMLKMYSGWAETPVTTDTNSTFSEQCLKNDILDYSDIYTYHSYGQVGARKTNHGNDSGNKTHTLASDWYNRQEKPKWVTEGGFWLRTDNGEQHSLSNQRLQARGLILSLVKSIAAGNREHFWFILFNRYESFNGCQFGLLNEKETPYMSYSAYSNLTYQLGEGIYKGRMANLPEGAEGYLFDNGMNDTAVLWSENETEYTLKNVDSVVLTDWMGTETVLNGKHGSLTVTLNENPVYLRFNGVCAVSNYEPEQTKQTEEAVTPITDAQRIVINPKFRGETDEDTKLGGYHIPKSNPQTFSVEVYNFNSYGTDVALTAQIGSGYTVTPKNRSVYVPAMGRVVLTYKVGALADANRRAYLTLGGTLNGEAISKSVLKLQTDPVWIEPSGTVTGYNEAWRWQTWYVTSGAEVSATSGENEITFSLQFNGGDRWFYPQFTLSDADKSAMANAAGISFEMEFPEEISGTINAAFFGFLQNPIPIQKGVQKIQIPFTEFKGTVDFDSLTTISLGVNPTTDEPFSYTIRNFGYYGTNEGETAVRISGISENQIFEDETVTALVTLPEHADLSTLRILLNHEPYSRYTADGKQVTVDLSGLERGGYELFAGVDTENGSAERKNVRFYVDKESEEREMISRIEGESCEKASHITYLTGDRWSGGSCMEMHRGDAPEEEYRIDYPVCVPAEGMYRLTAFAGYGQWFSPAKVRVNGETYSLTALSTDGLYVDQTAKIRLHAGENLISFTVTEHRAADTQYCFHMDYFDLEWIKDAWKLCQPLRLEGECFTDAVQAMKLTQSWNAASLDFSRLSGRNGLKMESTKTPPQIVYHMNAEKSGYYQLSMVCSPLDDPLTYCQMKMTVNQTEYLLDTNHTEKTSGESFSCDGKFGYYQYNGLVYLEQGENEIILSPIAARTYDQMYYFYMDYFDFTYQEPENPVLLVKQYLKEGASEKLVIRVPADALTEAVQIESGNPEIISVSDYWIYANKPGKTILTVSLSDGRKTELPMTVYAENGLALSENGAIENYSGNLQTVQQYHAEYQQEESGIARLKEVQKETLFLLPGMFRNLNKQNNQTLMLWDDAQRPIFPAIQN